MAAGEQFVINVVMTGEGQVASGAAKVSGSVQGMEAATTKAAAGSAAASQTLAQKWTHAGSSLTAAGKKVNRGVTLPILAIGAVTGKFAIDFEKQMRNVNSIAQLPEPTFQRLNKQVLAMAGPTAQAPKTLAEGLYDLVSSGFDAKESIVVLNASARAATAGLTTTEVSTKAVAAALNAYHRPASDAVQISDDLFQTVNLGVVTFDELASSIGYVLPAANTMNIDIKEVGASISTLTKEGQSGSNAVTNINAAITAFIKPSKGMKAVLKELGYETSSQLLKQKGFQGALELVTRAVGGNREAIGKLFPNVRAMRAVFGLTGSGAKSAAADLRGFQTDAGATSKVLAEQSKSLAFQWQKLKAEGSVLAIELGTKLIPVFRSVAHDVGHIVQVFTDLPAPVQSGVVKLLMLGVVLGPIIRVAGAVATAIGGIATAIEFLGSTTIVTAIGQAITGDLAMLTIIGSDVAGALMAGLVTALPFVAAAAGVVNILSSVLGGDSKGAMYKTGGAIGGALIGGIIGSVVPGLGTVIGAAVGGGAGSFLGGFLGDLMGESKKLTPLQEKLSGSAHGVAAAFRDARQAADGYAKSGGALHRAQQRARSSSQGVTHAENALRQARRRYGPDSEQAIRSEVRLANAKREDVQATKAVRNAERLHGTELRATKDLQRFAILEERHRINVLEQSKRAINEKRKAMKEEGATLQELKPVDERWLKTTRELRKAHKQQADTLTEAAKTGGAKWAHFLEEATQGTVRMGKRTTITLQDLKEPLGALTLSTQNYGTTTGKVTGNVRGAYEKTKGVLGPFRAETNRQLGKAATDAQSFSRNTVGAFVNVEGQTNRTLTALGVKQVNFDVSKGGGGSPQRKAQGGIVTIPGSGKHDTVPLNVMGTPVVAAPGEQIAFLTDHQQRELGFAVEHTFGDKGLSSFFQRQDTPHYMARGGEVKTLMSGKPEGLKLHGPALFTHEGPDNYGAAFQHNRRWAQPPPWQTELGPTLEAEFRKWLKDEYPRLSGGESWNPDAARVGYDLRGWWRNEGRVKRHAGRAFFTDTFKTPFDAGFSRWSKYAKPGAPFDWINERVGEGVLADMRDGQIILDHRHPENRQHEYSSDRNVGKKQQPRRFARGGILEPQLGGGGPMQTVGQTDIHSVTAAARAYVRKAGGDKTVRAVKDNGNRMDALHKPYLWGGGHGAVASHDGPWDCSGGISELLYGAGWKDLTPMVSSGFESFGEPGTGPVTVYANPEHVYGVVDNRAIGTSSENPGGGFGWINGYTSRPGFTVRHAELAGEGTPSAGANRGKGQRPAKGFAKGGWVSVGSTLDPTSGQAPTYSDHNGMSFAELLVAGDNAGLKSEALYRVLGIPEESSYPYGMPMETPILARRAGKGPVKIWKNDVGSGQSGDAHYKIDLHSAAMNALGAAGNKDIEVAKVGTSESAPEEQVPAVFHGARTQGLNFGSVPKSLHGVEREISRRSAELRRYRQAVTAAKGKPKVEHAIAANVTALENRLKELRRQRALLRREAAKKRIGRKLGRKLGKITGFADQMEAAERVFTIADQTAQQIVGLEPVQPVIPEKATDAEREALEKKHAEDFARYISDNERPAFATSLGALADWRNVSLLGERQATRLETGWEREVRQVEGDIDRINTYTAKVADDTKKYRADHPKATDLPDWLKAEVAKDHKERARLPVLRFREGAVRKTLGEAREEFYGGRKEPLRPPNPPMAGTGTIEDVLVGIQGTHWPDQHSPMKPLPGTRRAGWFGGSIWDVQTSIEELDLKVNDNIGAGGSSGPDTTAADEAAAARLAALEEENRILRRTAAVEKAQRPVLGGYLGAYKKGGVLPADGFYEGHKDETVIPADSGALMETHVHVNGRDGVLEQLIDVEVERRLSATGRRIGLGRSTPSAPGRRAAMTQGRSRRR